GRLRAPAVRTQAHLANTQPAATSSHGREERGRAFSGDCPMSETTTLLDALPPDDAASAAQLLPLVFDDLRRLAAHRLAPQAPGQNLDPTALVHEASLRLMRHQGAPAWHGPAPLFAPAPH